MEEASNLDAAMSVAAMANELGACSEKIRRWCANGKIEGAWNIGDKKYQYWRATRRAVLAFKETLKAKERTEDRKDPQRSKYVYQHLPAHLRA